MHKLLHCFVLLAATLPVATQAGEPSDAQRKLFLESYRKVEARKAVDVEASMRALGDYVLGPYLRYGELRARLAQAEPTAVRTFLNKHGDLAAAESLRRDYLGMLGERGEWKAFLSLYKPTNVTSLRCYRLRALRSEAAIDAAWRAEARSVWNAGGSDVRACDPVFEAMAASGDLSADDLWARAMAAVEAGDSRRVERLKPRLDQSRQRLLEQWLSVVKRPALLRSAELELAPAIAPNAIRAGLHRMAKDQPEEAMALVDSLADRFKLGELERAKARRAIAVRAAWSQHPQALEWLATLPEAALNDDVLLWRARLTLLTQDWSKLLTAIEALPESMQAEPQWRYWRGFALDQTGREEEGRALLGELAGERQYYGFLAADHLRRPYNFNNQPARFDEAELALLEADIGIQRAREFHRLGLKNEAAMEWRAALARFDKEQQARAAALALKWGWYDRAVLTANAAGLDDALDLRFPTPYREQVEHYSRMHKLDPAITYAILRKESAFRVDAVSPVGALGLMQVMPQTGKQIARELKLRPPGRHGLLEMDTNLRFGSYYLSSMLDRYGGNLALAAAAYNAGPHRVSMWVERNPDVLPTVWIEGISFAETRDYVKSVLAFRAVFDWQLHGRHSRVADYLRPLDKGMVCRIAQGESYC